VVEEVAPVAGVAVELQAADKSVGVAPEPELQRRLLRELGSLYRIRGKIQLPL